MMKKWYHIILTKNQWAKLKPILMAAKYTYEPSGYGENIHLSVLLNPNGVEKVNKYLEAIMA